MDVVKNFIYKYIFNIYSTLRIISRRWRIDTALTNGSTILTGDSRGVGIGNNCNFGLIEINKQF